LYNLDKVWVDLDQHNRPIETLRLPHWACPSDPKLAAQHQQGQPQPVVPRGNAPRQDLVQQETLSKVREMCEQVGHSLSQFALTTYGGVTDPAKLGFAKLTTVLDKLSDLENGIARLKRAEAALGCECYAAICQQYRLPSHLVDDIPNRDALKSLLAYAEGEAAKQGKEPLAAPARPASIADARGRLLQVARKAAENPQGGWPRKLGEVIARASGGELTLDTLKNLTDADTQAVESFIAIIEGGAH